MLDLLHMFAAASKSGDWSGLVLPGSLTLLLRR
jgi:hypothetical protein